MDENIDDIIYLIQESTLDQTIKDILIRDLKSDGLTDFMREQIHVYCVEGIKKLDEKIEAAKKMLENSSEQNPTE